MNDLTKISLFRNVRKTTPFGDIFLSDFYDCVQNGDYKTEIEKIRACTDPEKIKELKKKMPAVTISGTFKIRNAYNLIKHSSRICIDIDGKENTHIDNWEEVRDTLGTWKEVEFASLSVSGKGLFVVVLIAHPEKHVSQYKALEAAFKKYGITIDRMCKDLPRLRFLTYDADAILNDYVIPYRVVNREANRVKKVYNNSSDELSRAVNEIISKGVDITGSYSNWYEIGCALVNEYGERGRDMFHGLSQNYADYKYSECDKQFDKCLRNPKGYTAATIFHYKKQLV